MTNDPMESTKTTKLMDSTVAGDQTENATNQTLKRLVREWQALWPADLAVEFAMPCTRLVDKLLQEAEQAENRPKRVRQFIQMSRVQVVSDYAKAAADDRDGICNTAYQARLEMEDDLEAFHVGVPDAAVPLAMALRSAKLSDIKSRAMGMLQMIESGLLKQETLWMLLVQHPYSFKVYDCPDLVAIRLLPDFIGGMSNFRQSMMEHIQDVCESYQTALNSHDVELMKQFIHRFSNSPLTKIESCTWWTRILLERFNEEMSTDSLPQKQAIVRAHLEEVSPRNILAREMKAYEMD